jgi:hypothetical protein
LLCVELEQQGIEFLDGTLTLRASPLFAEHVEAWTNIRILWSAVSRP